MSKFYTVARSKDIEPGQVKYVEIEDYRLAICNLNGKIYAFENTCTHDGGPLDRGHLEGDVIECPRHGGQFNVTSGKAVRMPAVAPIETYPVTIEDGLVKVELD